MRASVLALALMGCATTSPSPSTNPAEEWYPLAVGNAWSYDADGTLVVVKVRSRDGARAQMGEFSYEVRPDGIVRLPQGKYVLQVPATAGREWALPGGGRAHITTASEGEVTVEEDDGAGTRTLTRFRRGVGPVDVIVSSGGAATHARLLGFTRAGDEI